jgi:predicted dehydrogenase
MIQGNFAYRVPEGRESRFFKPELGGGALLDRGVYLISLAQHLLGVPQTIRGSACVGATGVDEQSAYQLVFDSGAIADLSASLCVRGTNEVVISGDSGLLRLCEPFYCADRFTIQAHAHPRAAAQEDAQAEPTGLRKVTRAVRDASTTRLLRRRLSPIVSALRRGKARSFPFPGNGYQFELKHVNECLGEHRTESPIMPLNQSLEVMQTMDILRNQMGLNETSAAMRTV